MSCEPTGEPETTDRAGKEQYEYLHIQRRRSIYALVSHGLYEIAFLAAIELRESSRGGERAPQGAHSRRIVELKRICVCTWTAVPSPAQI